MIFRSALLSLVCLFFATVAQARDFHVDPSHPRAHDRNAGAVDLPLKTLSEGARRARAGDRVIVHPGTYRESVELRHSGTPEQPIQFLAQGHVIIDGGQIITQFQRHPSANELPIYRAPWSKRFIIDRDGDTIIQHHPPDEPIIGRAELMLCDGQPLLQVGSLDELIASYHAQNGKVDPPIARLGTFAGRAWFDWQHNQVCFWLVNGDDPANHQIEIAAESLLLGCDPFTFPDGIQHVQVRGFTFRHASNFAQRPAVWLHGRDNLLEDCIIETVAGQGVSVNGTLRRCIIRNCGHIGGAAAGDNFLNDACLWENNSWKPHSRAWEAGGAKITRAGNGAFTKCLFRNNGGPGLWLDIDVRNVRIDRCAFADNQTSGLMIEISRDIRITNCLFSGNGVGHVGTISPDDWGNAGILLAESFDCLVSHCTMRDNANGIALREQGPRTIDLADGSTLEFHCKNLTLTRNHVASNHNYQLALYWDNLFFGPHPARNNADLNEIIYDPARQNITIADNHFVAAPGQRLILLGAPWRPKSQTPNDCPVFGSNTFLTRQPTFPPAD